MFLESNGCHWTPVGNALSILLEELRVIGSTQSTQEELLFFLGWTELPFLLLAPELNGRIWKMILSTDSFMLRVSLVRKFTQISLNEFCIYSSGKQPLGNIF